MYTLIEKTSSCNADESGKVLQRVVIQVDTSDDVPEADASWDVGSICMIAATHGYKVLNSEREWV